MTNSFSEFKKAKMLFVIGSNMTEAHPVAATFLKNAVRAGAKLIVVDPRNHKLATFADLHVPVKVGSDIAFLNTLMHVLIKEDLYDLESTDFKYAYGQATSRKPSILSRSILSRRNFVQVEAFSSSARKSGMVFRRAMAMTCSEGASPGWMVRIHEPKDRQIISGTVADRICSKRVQGKNSVLLSVMVELGNIRPACWNCHVRRSSQIKGKSSGRTNQSFEEDHMAVITGEDRIGRLL